MCVYIYIYIYIMQYLSSHFPSFLHTSNDLPMASLARSGGSLGVPADWTPRRAPRSRTPPQRRPPGVEYKINLLWENMNIHITYTYVECYTYIYIYTHYKYIYIYTLYMYIIYIVCIYIYKIDT